MWFERLFDKEKKKELKKKRLEKEAEEIFDVTLHKDSLWMCYRGELVVPMTILTDKTDAHEYAALISVIRKLYVERKV